MSSRTALEARSPTVTRSTATAAAFETSIADRSLRRLEHAGDDHAVDALLRRFLARRRAVRQARRELAARQARHEHELLTQRALLGTGLSHLR